MARSARLRPQQRTPRGAARLSHVAGRGAASRSRMVDVSAKPTTSRSATARAVLKFPRGLLAGVLAGRGPKGPITEVARAAGVLGAKRTAELIPMCHPLALAHVEIAFHRRGAGRLEVRCTTRCQGPTGVEMEALVGAALAALTVYDMTKALGHGIAIERVELVEKRGGRSGIWRRDR